jgi:hypothetical protein
MMSGVPKQYSESSIRNSFDSNGIETYIEKTSNNSNDNIEKTSSNSNDNIDSMEKIGLMIQKKINNANLDNKKLDDRSFISNMSIQQRIADTDTLSERSKHFLTEYIERLEELKWIHSRSSEYYERRNLMMTLPSIILTSVSGILSLMSTSNYASDRFQYNTSITVGVIAATSSVFQTLSSTLKFGTKCELHRDVADRYDKIITNIKFEFIDHSDDNFISELEKQILEVQNMCKYFPPMHFYEEYKIFKKKEQAHKILTPIPIDNYNLTSIVTSI